MEFYVHILNVNEILIVKTRKIQNTENRSWFRENLFWRLLIQFDCWSDIPKYWECCLNNIWPVVVRLQSLCYDKLYIRIYQSSFLIESFTLTTLWKGRDPIQNKLNSNSKLTRSSVIIWRKDRPWCSVMCCVHVETWEGRRRRTQSAWDHGPDLSSTDTLADTCQWCQ